MIRIVVPIAVITLGLLAATATAQTLAPPDGSKTLAATMNVYVFPSEGQSSEVQSQEESECYGWAVKTVGVDPFDLQKQAQQQAQSAEAQKQSVAGQGRGAGAKGAVVGAAGGALIGEIASNDPGEGAAWGAAAGAIGGRRRARRKQADVEQQIDQQTQKTQQATEAQIENFKKAFAVCLEAKDYTVKF